MLAFQKFDPYAFRAGQGQRAPTTEGAKVAKAAKVGGGTHPKPKPQAAEGASLATLATLAAPTPANEPRGYGTGACRPVLRTAADSESSRSHHWQQGISRLDASVAWGDVPARRWTLFVDDCHRFLDQG